MEKFEFDPVRGFEDGSAYPNPSNEAEVREQLMRPLLQLQTFVNNLVDKLSSSEGINEIGTADGTLTDLLEKYVLQKNLTNDLKTKLDVNLGKNNKGLVLYIDDSGNVTPIPIEKIGTALTEDVVMRYQGEENVGKVLVVDKGGQVVPVMGIGGGDGASSFYDIEVKEEVLEIKCVVTNELEVTDDGNGNVTFS